MKVPNKLIVLTVIIIMIVIGIRMSGITSVITLDSVKSRSLELRQMIQEHYIQSALAYTGLVALIAAISIPLIVLLVVAGGFLFGALLGALYATIGATIGGSVSFIVFRYFLRSFVQEHYAAQFIRFNEKIDTYGYTYIVILHYLTVIPLFIINMFAALTSMSLLQFVGLTLLGSAPLYLVYAFAGRELAHISCVQDIFSAQIILACALLVVVALVPMMLRAYQTKH